MLKNRLRVPVHFVWATWDRLPLITEDIERRLYRYIGSVCGDHHCKVLAVGGMPDHIHLLVLLPGTVTLAQVMKDVKGGSSHFVSHVLKPGEWFAWQGSYSASAVGSRDQNAVIRYIANQKQHHIEGSLWPDAEETSEGESG